MWCAVSGCNNNNDNGNRVFSYFSFPKDKNMLKHWIQFCRRKDTLNVKSAVICSAHFIKTDFSNNLKYDMGFCKFRLLNPGAIPSVMPNALAAPSRLDVRVVAPDFDESILDTERNHGEPTNPADIFDASGAERDIGESNILQKNNININQRTTNELDIKIETDPLEGDFDSFMEFTPSFNQTIINEGANQQKIKGKRKVWTRPEIMLLLSCYASRKDEFYNKKQKKTAFANVLKDMQGLGFMDKYITGYHLAGKMRTLLESYKSLKSKNVKPSANYYYAKMDEIFGSSKNQPVDSISAESSDPKSHSEQSNTFPTTISEDQEFETGFFPKRTCRNSTKRDESKFHFKESMSSPPSIAEDPEFETDFVPSEHYRNSKRSNDPQCDSDDSMSTSPVEEPEAETDFAPKRHIRKTVREKYYEKKLQLKVQRMAQQKDFMNEMKNMIKIELEKLNAIEERKLKILESLLDEKK